MEAEAAGFKLYDCIAKMGDNLQGPRVMTSHTPNARLGVVLCPQMEDSTRSHLMVCDDDYEGCDLVEGIDLV